MASASRRFEPQDGVRVTRAGRIRRDVWAALIVAVGFVVGLLVLRSGEPPPPPRMAAAPPAPAASDTPKVSPPADTSSRPITIPTTRGARLRALRAAGIRPKPGPSGRREIDAAPVIDALNKTGVHEGIAAFPPPGTDPPKSGIVVPEAWVLPEGYVRHVQTTDDGKTLPPILMFHPDYEFTDEHGNPIAVPEDRVVPPELVPPGFPVEMLDVPGRDR